MLENYLSSMMSTLNTSLCLMSQAKNLVDSPVNFLGPGVSHALSRTSCLVRAANQSLRIVCDIMLRPPGEKIYSTYILKG